MNRALPFLLLVAVIAGGLGYFALQSDGRGPTKASDDALARTDDAETREPATAPEATETAELAAVSNERVDVGFDEPPAKSWEIIPMNSVGQLMADAKITATQQTTTRTAEGRTKWEDIESGPWTLVVEAEGMPLWRRELVLQPGKRERTAVRLGEEVQVQGRVVDTAGAAVGRTNVFLLPNGVVHPDRSQMKRDRDRPRDPAVPTNGAVVAEVSANGKWRAQLPTAGEWRISVGRPGQARWTQREATTLTYGGPDNATVTVPANARLTLTFDGGEDERPVQVSAYQFDAEQARIINEGRAERFDGGKGGSLEDAQRAAKERGVDPAMQDKLKKLGYGGTGTARTIREEMNDTVGVGQGDIVTDPRYVPQAQQLFEPGWRSVRTARFDEEGVAKLIDLPGGVDLRFLFVRERERIVTASSYRLEQGQLSAGRVTLPPPGTSPEDIADSRASIQIGLGSDGQESEITPGVVWGF